MSITLKCDDGDLLVSTGGSFILVNGLQKCAQDVAESLLNNWDIEGPNPFNGSELYLIAEDPTSLNIVSVEERVRSAVEDSIMRLQDLQEADDWAEEEEIINEIRSISVRRVGLMSYGFYLNLVTMSEDYIPQDFFINLGQQLPKSLDQGQLINEFMTAANKMNAPYA